MMISEIVKIAVIITCHNRISKTLKCLESVEKSYFGDVSIITDIFMVDDGSTDGTSEAVETRFPYVNIIRGDGTLFWNQGMRLAWNTAIRHGVKYDYYLLLNDDVILTPNAILNLYLSSSLNSIVCGSVSDGTKVTYGGYNENDQLLTQIDFIQNCEYCNGNILLVSATCIDKIGILSDSYSHSLGDFDYTFRANRMDVQLILNAGIHGMCEGNVREKGWHVESNSIVERFRSLYHPLGGSIPHEFFVYTYRRRGVFWAMMMYLWLHFSTLFPVLRKFAKSVLDKKN